MNIEKLSFSFPAIANADFGIVVDEEEVYKYDKEQHMYTDEKTGVKLTVVLPEQMYEKITVLLPLDGLDKEVQPNIKVKFENFQAQFYRNFNTGEYNLVCRATRAIAVK